MRIIVISQPYPMGNGCGLNQAVAKFFESQGHEVFFVEQLNGNEAGIVPFHNMIYEAHPDLLYYEMLDHATFQAIEGIKCKKILLYASNGILKNFLDIVKYHNSWYDAIYTNSAVLNESFNRNGIISKHFKYYHCWMSDNDIDYDEKYNHDCTFLGMGFNRLQSDDYKLERELFFLQSFPFDYKIYGNGWPKELPWYNGLLPQEDMGKLYTSTKSAFAIIAPSQRSMGMINNRFSEIAFCNTPIITYPYEKVDWFGAEKYLNFVKDKQDIIDVVNKCINGDDVVRNKAQSMEKFIKLMTNSFYNGLLDIVELL